MKISATIQDSTDFPRIQQLAETASKEALRKACQIVAAEARRRAPRGNEEDRAWKKSIGRKSPILSKSIRTRTGKSRRGQGLFWGSIYTTDGTGMLIESGTGLYGRHQKAIEPKGTYMTFAWPQGGIGIFRMKKVRGRKATPFLLPALKAKASSVIEALKDGFDR